MLIFSFVITKVKLTGESDIMNRFMPSIKAECMMVLPAVLLSSQCALMQTFVYRMFHASSDSFIKNPPESILVLRQPYIF